MASMQPSSGRPRTGVRKRAWAPLSLALVLSSAILLIILVFFPAQSVSVPGWSDEELPQRINGTDRRHLSVDGGWVCYIDQTSYDIVVHDVVSGATRLSAASGERQLSLAGGWVAWQDWGTGKVHVEDCSSGLQRTMVTGAIAGPVVTSDYTFWVGVNSSGDCWSLESYDMSAGTLKSFDTGIARSAEVIRELDASGSWAAWSQVIWTGPNAGASEISVWDRDTGAIFNLSARLGTDEMPQISGEWVVWVGSDDNDDEIFLQKVTGGPRIQLTDNSVDDGSARIAGDYAVWIGGSSLHLYRISTGTQTVITNGGASRPDIGGGWVVWEESSGVWIYDISQSVGTKISDQLACAGWAGFPATDGQTVAYVDNNLGVHLSQRSATTTTATSSTTTISTTSTDTTTRTSLPPITTTTTIPGSGGQTFPDVPPSHPYYEAIEGMAGAGVIGGYADGRFGPGDSVMRQQFAKMIVGTIGLPCSESDICPFWDVTVGGPATLYPDNYVAVAAANEITRGTGAGKFGPYLNITRAQVITMVVRAAQNFIAGLQTPAASYYQTGLFASFNDPTHGYNVQLAEANGLLKGLQGSVAPTAWIWGSATRGEVAQILWNLINTPGLAG